MGGFLPVPGAGESPGGSGAGLGDLIGWAGGILAGGGGCTCQQQMCQLASGVLNWVGGYTGPSFAGLGAMLGDIWGWIQKAADWFFKHVILNLWNFLLRIKARLARILKPILDYIKYEKQLWQWTYEHYVRPVLDFISKLRRTLAIFRLLHVGWATKLDNYLGQVQAEIERVVIGIRQQLNQLSSYINLILDPSGRFNANIYLDTLQSSAKAAWDILFGKVSAPAPDLGAAVQSPAWDNYSQTQAAGYAATTMRTAPQSFAQDLHDQGATMFQALGYKVN